MSAALELSDAAPAAASWWQGLAPPPALTVSEWADRDRYLTSGAEPGQWRTSRVPYLREIMDCFSARSRVRKVVVMKAAQLGFSEALNNVIGYSIAHNPRPIIMLQPTEQRAIEYSKDRIAPMISASPSLRDQVGDAKSRDSSNTLQHKSFPGGSLAIIGSNAPSGLASRAAAIGLCDEVDRFADSAGSEGDPVDLLAKRLTTFGAGAKMGLISTPTVKGASRIELAYEDSDRRLYELACPHCGACQALEWAQVRWPKGRPADAAYHCVECDEPWTDAERIRALQTGEWVPQNPGHPTRGYWISGLYHPWRTIGDIAEEFYAVRRDPTRFQVFVNTVWGQSWDPMESTSVDEGMLLSLREPYTSEALPSPIVLLTAAVDVQHDRLELEVNGWAVDEERWHVDLVVITGDPSARGGGSVWATLDRWLTRTWRTEDGRDLPIGAACIDSGGEHTVQVYEFCAPRHGRRVYAVKGRGMKGERKPLWPRRPSRTKKSARAPFYVLGVDAGKDACRSRLEATIAARAPSEGEPELRAPGMVHWPVASAYGRAYFEQLTAEEPVIEYSRGRPYRVWHCRKGRKNEAFDLDVYGLAALHAWKALGFSLDKTAAAQARNAAPRPPEETRKARPSRHAKQPRKSRLPSLLSRKKGRRGRR